MRKEKRIGQRMPQPGGGRLSGAVQTAVPVDPMIGRLRDVAAALRDEIAGCTARADVETVHRVRTGTRRVEAQLETILRQRGGMGASVRQAAWREAAVEWLRQLKKVRRAAGSVRDLDVHREIVAEKLLGVTREAAGAGESSIQSEVEELDSWLAKMRAKRESSLIAQLGKCLPKLETAEQAFLFAIPPVGGRSGAKNKPMALLALEDYLRLVDSMPTLEAENLHDFRKGAKKARYVAEAGGGDSDATAIAGAIKRVQDAIGDWHDWLMLRDEARAALGSAPGSALGSDVDPAGARLVVEIQRGVARRFVRAMRTTERMSRRLLGEWLARKPVRRAGGRRAGAASY